MPTLALWVRLGLALGLSPDLEPTEDTFTYTDVEDQAPELTGYITDAPESYPCD